MWGNVPDTWYNEVKTTINGVSTLYATQSGIPADTDLVTLQIVRSGDVFVVLRRHDEGGGWIIENRFTRGDMPATLQVGITTYTDWPSAAAQDAFHHNRTVNTGGNPDLVADADYFRLRRPAAAITPGALQSLPVTGPGGALAQLAGTALESVLGGNAQAPVVDAGMTFDDWLRENLTPGQLVLPALTTPVADANGNGIANAVEFALGTADASPLHLEILGPPEARILRLTFPRDTRARGVTLHVESHSTLEPGAWTPLAESVNGAPPAAAPGVSATIQETGGDVRLSTLEMPAPAGPHFFRVRVEMAAP